MRWFISKTYRHKCPNGAVKIVYRSIDDAFPLFLPGWQAKIAADIKVPEVGAAGVKADCVTKIDGLLFNLDELNNSLMMKFRGAYVAFQTDPCANSGALQHQVQTISNQHHQLLVVKIQIQAFVELAKISKNDEQVVQAYWAIVRQLGDGAGAPAAALAIAESREEARKWAGGADVG